MSRTPKKRGPSCLNRPLPGVLVSFATSTMTELSTALSQRQQAMLSTCRYGDAILAEGVNPLHYSNFVDFKYDYLASELLSKWPIDIGIDRDKVALDAFESAEVQCAETNRRFEPRGVRNWPFWERSVMETARLKISKWLRPFHWDEAAEGFAFGPGATTSLSRRNAGTEKKLQFGSDITPGALHALEAVMNYNVGWNSALDEFHMVRPRVVRGSKIVTVPKNAKTNRVIAIEPDLNMYLQKGLGRLIRRRLRRAGLDLNNAWRTNHTLACEGSEHGTFATIDLKSASDSIAYKLIEWLVPDDWFRALDLARSRQAILPSGDWVSLQKFSSMGNGFTFELESMIFYALVRSVLDLSGTEGHVSVFGDDIIVPTGIYDGVKRILSHCGFTVNEKKTFAAGPFRESCGKHYFAGRDVTPFYLRSDRETTLSLISALNRAREWSRHSVWGLVGLQGTYTSHAEKLPFYWRRPRIPYGYGDGALFGDFDEVRPTRAPRGTEGWLCDVLLPVNQARQSDSRFSVLASLMRMRERESAEPKLEFRPGDFSGRYKKGRILVTQWPAFGPWWA